MRWLVAVLRVSWVVLTKPPAPDTARPPGDSQTRLPGVLRLTGLSMKLPNGAVTPTTTLANAPLRICTPEIAPRVSKLLKR